MISFHDLISLGFLLIAGYAAYWFKTLVEVLRSANFTNYESYKKAVSETERKVWKPTRKRDDEGIRRIIGDRTKLTLKDKNGLAHTKDTLVDITEADPEAVMDSIDELGRVKG